MGVIGKNLVLIGMMGTYKTSAGTIAAERLSMLFADSDAIFEFEYSMKIKECFDNFGEAHFRKYESKVIEHLAECEGILIATGGGSVLKASNVEALRQNGVLIHLTASAETILARIKDPSSRPLLAGNTEASVRELLACRLPLYESAAHYTVSTDGLEPWQVADRIVEVWRAANCT